MKLSLVKNLKGIIAIVIWSVSIPLIKQVSADLDSQTILGLSFIIGGFFSLLFCLLYNNYKINSFFTINFLLRAICFTVYFKLFYFSIDIVPTEQIPLLTLTNYLWPTITIVLVIIFTKQKLHFSLFFIGITLIIVSIFIEFKFTEFKDIPYFPILLTFIAATSWGFYNLLSKLNSDNTNMTPIFMLIAGLTSLSQIELRSDILTIPYLPYLIFFPAIANICWASGIKNNIIFLSLLADFLPWLSLISSYLILNIHLEIKSLMTITLVIIGAIISRYSIKL